MEDSTINKDKLLIWLANCVQIFNEKKDFLTQLDADVGDADHGINMKRGFDCISQKLPAMQKQNLSSIFKMTGMTLMHSVGGASGPLYGTFFIRIAEAVKNKTALTLADVVFMFNAGLEGMLERGQAKKEDKTLCDVWWAVINKGEQSLEKNMTLNEGVMAMCQAADDAVIATIEMQAKKGIASSLHRDSRGFQDPGATSSMLILKALQKSL